MGWYRWNRWDWKFQRMLIWELYSPRTLHHVDRVHHCNLQAMFSLRLEALKLATPLWLRVDTEAAISYQYSDQDIHGERPSLPVTEIRSFLKTFSSDSRLVLFEVKMCSCWVLSRIFTRNRLNIIFKTIFKSFTNILHGRYQAFLQLLQGWRREPRRPRKSPTCCDLSRRLWSVRLEDNFVCWSW